jgi:hypothetical protein
MDAYHKVLVKLYEETGGRETRQVDFASLLKKMGFYTAFTDILTRLNREGWIRTRQPQTTFLLRIGEQWKPKKPSRMKQNRKI